MANPLAKEKAMRTDVYERVTTAIVAELEKEARRRDDASVMQAGP